MPQDLLYLPYRVAYVVAATPHRDRHLPVAPIGGTNALVGQVLGPWVSVEMAVDDCLHIHQVGDVPLVGTFRLGKDNVLVLYILFRIPRRPRPSTVVMHGLT